MELHPIIEKGEWLCKQNVWYVASAKGEHPSMGVGQSCCHIPAASNAAATNTTAAGIGKLVVIGGANPNGPFDVTHFLDWDEYEWDEPELTGFTARYEHACFQPPAQPQRVFVFGGAEKEQNLDSVQMFDSGALTWTTIETKGEAPSPRTCRGSASEGSRLFIFGGGHQGSNPVNDTRVHVFDADTNEWTQLPARGRTPSARHGHVMALCGGKLYVHGGMSGNSIHDDMHAYDIESGTWSVVKTKGDMPSGRAAHGCISHGNKIFIFGGMTQGGASDESFVFDTRKSRWTKLRPDGPPPAPRLDHAMCLMTLPCPRQGPGRGQARSAASSDNRAPSGDPASSAEEFLTSCVDAVAQQMSGEGAAGGADTTGQSAVSQSDDSEPTLCCLVHGGMDTQGEIFDDFLLLRLDGVL